jgi:hypothetical protein
MLDLRIPSGFFFALIGVILEIWAIVRPGLSAPLTVGNVNLYCGFFMMCFGGVLLWLARRGRS